MGNGTKNKNDIEHEDKLELLSCKMDLSFEEAKKVTNLLDGVFVLPSHHAPPEGMLYLSFKKYHELLSITNKKAHP